jgi:hypothetical protein
MLKFSYVEEKLEIFFSEYVDFFQNFFSIFIFISMTHIFFSKLNNYSKRKPKPATYLQ